MVTLESNTTATFFFVTDGRSTDRTRAEAPYTFAVDSSAAVRWWYTPPAPARK
jgi:hypothetical protein